MAKHNQVKFDPENLDLLPPKALENFIAQTYQHVTIKKQKKYPMFRDFCLETLIIP